MVYPLRRFFAQSYRYLLGECGEHTTAIAQRLQSHQPQVGIFAVEGEPQMLLPFFQCCEYSVSGQFEFKEEEHHEQH